MPQRITPVVLNLIFINVLIFFALNMRWDQLNPYFVLEKTNVLGFFEENRNSDGVEFWVGEYKGNTVAFVAPEFKPIQVVTSIFSHVALFHIVFNMLALVFLGSLLEMAMGPLRFLEAYLFAGVLGSIFTCTLDPSPNPVLGASGAISGLLVLLAYYYPNMPINLMFIPFNFTARSYALFFACASATLILLQLKGIYLFDSISHFGHLAGMAAGFIYFHRLKILKFIKLK